MTIGLDFANANVSLLKKKSTRNLHINTSAIPVDIEWLHWQFYKGPTHLVPSYEKKRVHVLRPILTRILKVDK
jgi:hypothetical protein